MIRGIYSSAWSMLANSKQMDAISNNLANVDTNAFKKDTVVFESFPSLLTKRINDTKSPLNPSGEIGTMQMSSDVGEIYTYYNQGQLLKTGNSLDLAFQGNASAFFTVSATDAEGNAKEYYTRDGAFTLDANGQLVTKDGYTVMGEDGPVTLKGSNFSVEADGLVIQDGQIAGKLLIKEFTDTKTLRKFGSNLVEKTDETEERAFSGGVGQGVLEQSNVNTIKEMIDMINVSRSYESNQKILQIQDGTLEKIVNEVGIAR